MKPTKYNQKWLTNYLRNEFEEYVKKAGLKAVVDGNIALPVEPLTPGIGNENWLGPYTEEELEFEKRLAQMPTEGDPTIITPGIKKLIEEFQDKKLDAYITKWMIGLWNGYPIRASEFGVNTRHLKYEERYRLLHKMAEAIYYALRPAWMPKFVFDLLVATKTSTAFEFSGDIVENDDYEDAIARTASIQLAGKKRFGALFKK